MNKKQPPQIGQLYTNVLSTKHLTVKILDHKNGHVLVQPTTNERTYWLHESSIHRYYQLTKEIDDRSSDDLFPETLVVVKLAARRSDALLEVVNSKTITYLPQHWRAARGDTIIKIINYDHPTVTAQFIISRRHKRDHQITMTYRSLRNRYRPIEQLFKPNITEVQVGMKLVARRSDSLLEVVEVGEHAVIARYIKTNDHKFRPGDHTKMTLASMRNNYTVQLTQ